MDFVRTARARTAWSRTARTRTARAHHGNGAGRAGTGRAACVIPGLRDDRCHHPGARARAFLRDGRRSEGRTSLCFRVLSVPAPRCLPGGSTSAHRPAQRRRVGKEGDGEWTTGPGLQLLPRPMRRAHPAHPLPRVHAASQQFPDPRVRIGMLQPACPRMKAAYLSIQPCTNSRLAAPMLPSSSKKPSFAWRNASGWPSVATSR